MAEKTRPTNTKTTKTKKTPVKPKSVAAKTTGAQDATRTPGWRSRRLKDIYFAVWSVVGLILIALAAVAVLGSGSWSENLNLKETAPAPGQSAQQPQQPSQPTQEELDCVMDEVGEERFMELQQGEVPEPDENAVIEECLNF